MSRDPNTLKTHTDIPALDLKHQPIKEGDYIRFVMRGFFLPREQETFGKILKIDSCGGIRIKVTGTYRHFTSHGKVAAMSNEVYFTHHRYESDRRSRIYHVESDGHVLFIEKWTDQIIAG